MRVKFLLDKQEKPTSEGGMKVLYGDAKRTGYRVRWFLILTILITPILILAYQLLRDEILVIAPGIVTYEPITLSSKERGFVDKVMVQKGDRVNIGDPLYKIRNLVLEGEIEFLENELKKLMDAKVKKRELNLSLYEKNVVEAEDNLTDVSKIRKRYDKYSQEGKISYVDFARVLSFHYKAKVDFMDAKINFNRATIESENVGLIGELAHEIRMIRKELNKKVTERNSMVIESPIDGVLIDSKAHEGEHVSEGDDLMLLATKNQAQIRAYLDPEHLDYAKMGGKVTVLFPNNTKFQGTISSPTEMASKMPPTLIKPFEAQKALLQISIDLEESPANEELIEGMPVEVIF